MLLTYMGEIVYINNLNDKHSPIKMSVLIKEAQKKVRPHQEKSKKG